MWLTLQHRSCCRMLIVGCWLLLVKVLHVGRCYFAFYLRYVAKFWQNVFLCACVRVFSTPHYWNQVNCQHTRIHNRNIINSAFSFTSFCTFHLKPVASGACLAISWSYLFQNVVPTSCPPENMGKLVYSKHNFRQRQALSSEVQINYFMALLWIDDTTFLDNSWLCIWTFTVIHAFSKLTKNFKVIYARTAIR